MPLYLISTGLCTSNGTHEFLQQHARLVTLINISGDCSSIASNVYAVYPELCSHLGRMSKIHYSVSFTAAIANLPSM